MITHIDPYPAERAARFARDRERALAHLRGAAESIERARQIIEVSTFAQERVPGVGHEWYHAAEVARWHAERAHEYAARQCTR